MGIELNYRFHVMEFFIMRLFILAYLILSPLIASDLTKDDFDKKILEPLPMEEHIFLKKTLDELPPQLYSHNFISTFHALIEGVPPKSRHYILILMKNFGPKIENSYFTDTINILSEGLSTLDKVNIIRTVAKVPQNLHKDFIDGVVSLSFQFNEEDLRYLFRIFCDIQERNIPFFIEFIKHDRAFFDHVPCKILSESVLFTHSINEMKNILKSLYAQYQRPTSNQKNQPLGLAFEIHNYADRIVDEKSELPLFKLVLFSLNANISKRYSIKECRQMLLKELPFIEENIKMRHEKRKDLNWVLSCQNTRADETILATVVSYLLEKDPTYGALRNWLNALIEESKQAYNGENPESCMQGVKERVITCLKSTLIDDALFCNYFSKAEQYFLKTTKVKKLSDYAYWAKRLMEKGINHTTPAQEAKNCFEQLLLTFFDPIQDQDVIQSTLAVFEDSNENQEDGFWSKIKERF